MMPRRQTLSDSQEAKPQDSIRRAREKLWRKGILHWKLDENQLEMYDFAKNKDDKILVIGCARRVGKSYFMTTLAIETCLATPNQIVKFIAPKAIDLRKIIQPLIRDITSDCPKDLLPKYNSKENIYKFHNGSEIHLAGTDNGRADSIRGGNANLCLIDEAGFCTELDYVVNSVLIPTTTLTGGKVIMASTPPKNMGHPFVDFMVEAEKNQAFIKRTIFDNKRLTKEDIDGLAYAVGGYDSVDFKREYMVEMITDTNFAVIPEWNPELELAIVKTLPKPEYYDAYVGMDIGGRDMTAVIFAYYDFRNGALIVEDELIMQGKDLVSDVLAGSIREKEQKLWLDYLGQYRSPYMRISDNNNIMLLNDLQIKHQLTFLPAPKDNADAQLNNLRLLLKSHKIIINPRCVGLISHLKNAIWNKARTSYVRNNTFGHFDALDALKYLVRMVDFNKNPYPAGYDLDPRKDYQIPIKASPNNKLDNSLRDIFKIRPNRRRY